MNEKFYKLIIDEITSNITSNILDWFCYEAEKQNLGVNPSQELINSLKELNSDIILKRNKIILKEKEEVYFLYELFDFFEQFNEEKLSKITKIVNDAINANIEIKDKLLKKINELTLNNIKESIFENLKNKEVFYKEFNYKYISDNKKNQLLENIKSEISQNLENLEKKIKNSLIEKINNNEMITLANIIKRRKMNPDIELDQISKECLSNICFFILNKVDSIFFKEKNTECLNIINNELEDIEIKINGEEKILKDFHNEIFNSENFNTNLNNQLETINKIFDQYKIPKINIEYFKFLFIQELFSNSKKIHQQIKSYECDKIIKDNEKFLFSIIVNINHNSYRKYVNTHKDNSIYYKKNKYYSLSSIIEKIHTLLTDDKKKEFNKDFQILDGIKKKINFFYDYIAQQRNEFTEFYNKYNNEPKEYNDINKKIKSNEREIMKIKEELENNFTDKKNVEYINKYNQYLKYYYDTINTLVELNLLNKELEKFNKFISDIENKVYDLMDKIINFIEEKSMINNLLDLLNDDQKKELTALLEKLKENEEKIKQNETKLLEDSKLVKYNVYEKSILQKIQDLKNNEFNNDEKKKLYDYLKDFYEKLITFDINDKIYNSIRQYINSEDKIIKIGHYLYDESEYIYPSQLLNLKQETDKKPHIEISFKENNTYINNSKTKKLKFTPNPDVIKEFKILDAPQELKNLNSINFT